MNTTPRPRSAPKHILAAALLATMAGPALADTAGTAQVPNMCPSVVATVMVGKMACSAPACASGNSQPMPPMFAGLLALSGHQVVNGETFSNGIAAMLVTALKQTGCFEVFDAVGLEELRKEMESLNQKIAPPPPVDYLVKATITKADTTQSSQHFLVVSRDTTTTTLKLDAKVLNAKLGTVSDAGAYESSSDRSSTGVSLIVFTSGDSSGRQGTPLSEVARDAVAKAAAGIASKILSQAPRPQNP